MYGANHTGWQLLRRKRAGWVDHLYGCGSRWGMIAGSAMRIWWHEGDETASAGYWILDKKAHHWCESSNHRLFVMISDVEAVFMRILAVLTMFMMD